MIVEREFYTIYLRLYQALLTSIKVHATPGDVVKEAVGKMDQAHGGLHVHGAKIKAAATRFVEGYRGRTTAAASATPSAWKYTTSADCSRRRSNPAGFSQSNRRCRSKTNVSASASRT